MKDKFTALLIGSALCLFSFSLTATTSLKEISIKPDQSSDATLQFMWDEWISKAIENGTLNESSLIIKIGEERTEKFNSQSEYQFTEIPMGRHLVTITAAGIELFSQNIDFDSAENKIIDLRGLFGLVNFSPLEAIFLNARETGTAPQTGSAFSLEDSIVTVTTPQSEHHNSVSDFKFASFEGAKISNPEISTQVDQGLQVSYASFKYSYLFPVGSEIQLKHPVLSQVAGYNSIKYTVTASEQTLNLHLGSFSPTLLKWEFSPAAKNIPSINPHGEFSHFHSSHSWSLEMHIPTYISSGHLWLSCDPVGSCRNIRFINQNRSDFDEPIFLAKDTFELQFGNIQVDLDLKGSKNIRIPVLSLNFKDIWIPSSKEHRPTQFKVWVKSKNTDEWLPFRPAQFNLNKSSYDRATRFSAIIGSDRRTGDSSDAEFINDIFQSSESIDILGGLIYRVTFEVDSEAHEKIIDLSRHSIAHYIKTISNSLLSRLKTEGRCLGALRSMVLFNSEDLPPSSSANGTIY